MRPGRVLAITRRDLRIEFKGRRAALLPAVATFLLAPIATAPSVGPPEAIVYQVDGDVPDDLLPHPEITRGTGPQRVVFRAPTADEPQLLVFGNRVGDPVRDALDADEPAVSVVTIRPPSVEVPKRSLFLALIAASVLTGALAQSIPGERSAGTLWALLTASVSKWEIVTGKWLAWGGAGALASILGCATLVGLGRQELGWWAVAVPWVPLGTVAMGLYLVRRANDVVGGATVAIRMLPAALTVLGMAAWWLGNQDPWLGASVPIGGALVAAGDTWPGMGPPIWATIVTAAGSALFLIGTARDLDAGELASREAGLAGAVLVAGVAAVSWWTPVLGSLLWAAGGAPERTEAIPTTAGIWAGALCLLALVAVRIAREPGGRIRPRTASYGRLGLAMALGLGAVLVAPSVATGFTGQAGLLWSAAETRFTSALTPIEAGPGAVLAVVVGQELLFRGWMRRHAGDIASTLLFALVVSPLDPALGLALGSVATAVTRVGGGTVVPIIALRLAAAALPAPQLATLPAVGVVLTAVLLLVALAPRRASP